jgi:hypothetical protein
MGTHCGDAWQSLQLCEVAVWYGYTLRWCMAIALIVWSGRLIWVHIAVMHGNRFNCVKWPFDMGTHCGDAWQLLQLCEVAVWYGYTLRWYMAIVSIVWSGRLIWVLIAVLHGTGMKSPKPCPSVVQLLDHTTKNSYTGNVNALSTLTYKKTTQAVWKHSLHKL